MLWGARHDGRHALAAVRGRVNVAWTGAAPLPYVQAVIVLKREKREEVSAEAHASVTRGNDTS